jgi:5-methylcytosine-specific restriction protein A
MREWLARWALEFPRAVRIEEFTASPVAQLVSGEISSVVRRTLGESYSHLKVKGSAGQGGWTHTPWVAILDPSVTASVQEGSYVVYLLSADGARLYLSVNQGCTVLQKAVGTPAAGDALLSRATALRNKLGAPTGRLYASPLNLGSKLWRASLYEMGHVVGAAYDTSKLPSEEHLLDDLQEALRLYAFLKQQGGWASEDDLLKDAESDGLVKPTLSQAKQYKQHRSIERLSAHARAVKKALGYRCMSCDSNLEEIYGPIGKTLIHAHHLTPLSALDDGVLVHLDPKKDFAVLCPNCHAIIHRMDDVSDVLRLRAFVLANR